MQLLELLQTLQPGGMVYEGSKRYLMRCPFHDDSNPSFGVRLTNGDGKCFSCGATADLPTILMKLTGAKSRLTAIRQASRLVMEAPDDTPTRVKPAAVKLLETTAPDFWVGRGLTLGDVHRFEFDTGTVAAPTRNQGTPVAIMPIFDRKHRLMGTCTRRIDPDVPKHLRYLYSAGMAKSECLWGVHLVEPPVDAIYLAEGIIKAAVMRSQGFEALSPLGSRVSKVQNRMVRQFTDAVIWVADSDPSGLDAADFHAKTYGYSVAVLMCPDDCDGCKDPDQQYVTHGQINLSVATARQWLRGKYSG